MRFDFVFSVVLVIFSIYGCYGNKEIQNKKRFKHISTKIYKPSRKMLTRYLKMNPPRFPPTFIHTRLRLPYNQPPKDTKWDPIHIKRENMRTKRPRQRPSGIRRQSTLRPYPPNRRNNGIVGTPEIQQTKQTLYPLTRPRFPTTKSLNRHTIAPSIPKVRPGPPIKTEPHFTTTKPRRQKHIHLFNPVTNFIPSLPDGNKRGPPVYTPNMIVTTGIPFMVPPPPLGGIPTEAVQQTLTIPTNKVEYILIPPDTHQPVTTTRRPRPVVVTSKPMRSLPPIILIRPKIKPLEPKATTMPPIVVPPVRTALFEEAKLPSLSIDNGVKRVAILKTTTTKKPGNNRSGNPIVTPPVIRQRSTVKPVIASTVPSRTDSTKPFKKIIKTTRIIPTTTKPTTTTPFTTTLPPIIIVETSQLHIDGTTRSYRTTENILQNTVSTNVIQNATTTLSSINRELKSTTDKTTAGMLNTQNTQVYTESTTKVNMMEEGTNSLPLDHSLQETTTPDSNPATITFYNKQLVTTEIPVTSDKIPTATNNNMPIHTTLITEPNTQRFDKTTETVVRTTGKSSTTNRSDRKDITEHLPMDKTSTETIPESTTVVKKEIIPETTTKIVQKQTLTDPSVGETTPDVIKNPVDPKYKYFELKTLKPRLTTLRNPSTDDPSGPNRGDQAPKTTETILINHSLKVMGIPLYLDMVRDDFRPITKETIKGVIVHIPITSEMPRIEEKLTTDSHINGYTTTPEYKTTPQYKSVDEEDENDNNRTFDRKTTQSGTETTTTSTATTPTIAFTTEKSSYPISTSAADYETTNREFSSSESAITPTIPEHKSLSTSQVSSTEPFLQNFSTTTEAATIALPDSTRPSHVPTMLTSTDSATHYPSTNAVSTASQSSTVTDVPIDPTSTQFTTTTTEKPTTITVNSSTETLGTTTGDKMSSTVATSDNRSTTKIETRRTDTSTIPLTTMPAVTSTAEMSVKDTPTSAIEPTTGAFVLETTNSPKDLSKEKSETTTMNLRTTNNIGSSSTEELVMIYEETTHVQPYSTESPSSDYTNTTARSESTTSELSSTTARSENTASELSSTTTRMESTTSELSSTTTKTESTTSELSISTARTESTTSELSSTTARTESTTSELSSTTARTEGTTSELSSTILTKLITDKTDKDIASTDAHLSASTTTPFPTTTEYRRQITQPQECAKVGCPRGRQCLTVKKTICSAEDDPSLCSCIPGCRLDNIYVSMGQPVVIDRCGNLCYCGTSGLTACTKIPCTRNKHQLTTPNPFKPVKFKPDVKDRGPTRGDSPYFYVDENQAKSVKVHGLSFPDQLLAWLSPFSQEFRENLPSVGMKEISLKDLFTT